MFETARPFLLSLALGLLIGIERERSLAQRGEHVALGARTFTLLALLGTMAAHIGSTAVAAVLAAFAGALVLAAYVRGEEVRGVGATTEVAAVATFALGYLAHREVALTAMLGVILAAVLAMKPRIHEFAREGLTPSEVNAALAFLVIAFVVLPLLPNRAIDPWGLVNPFRLWLLFVVIAGMGFGGYIAVRWLGPGRGLATAGFFAGLVSSTAATLSFSQRARSEPALSTSFATAIVLANVASAAAQLLVVAIANPSMTAAATWVVGTPVAVGAIAAAAATMLLRRGGAGTSSDSRLEGIRSPLDLGEAARFAAGLGAFLLLASLAVKGAGAAGALAAAAAGGLADVHAVTLGVSTLAAAGSLEPSQALLAILVAFVTNMAVKLGITAWAGGRALLARVAPPLALMALAAVGAYLAVVR